jgi:hypothetical protein
MLALDKSEKGCRRALVLVPFVFVFLVFISLPAAETDLRFVFILDSVPVQSFFGAVIWRTCMLLRKKKAVLKHHLEYIFLISCWRLHARALWRRAISYGRRTAGRKS